MLNMQTYKYFCYRQLVRFPAIGNPRSREFDFFRPRVGSIKARAKMPESFGTDLFTAEINDTQINTGSPFVITIPLGLARWVGWKANVLFRAGNIADPVTTFRRTQFFIMINGNNKYNLLGWNDATKYINLRLQGGERIDLVIYSPVVITLDEGSFFYCDLEVEYVSQSYLIDKEAGEFTVKPKKEEAVQDEKLASNE